MSVKTIYPAAKMQSTFHAANHHRREAFFQRHANIWMEIPSQVACFVTKQKLR